MAITKLLSTLAVLVVSLSVCGCKYVLSPDQRFLMAARTGDTAGVAAALADGADANTRDGEALYTAAGRGYTEMVTVLLQRGANVNAADPEGATALQAAAMHGHTEIVRLLLDHGANVNAVHHEYGYTPLHNAARKGHTEIVKILIERGADLDMKLDNGWTPLDMARKNGHRETVELLLAAHEAKKK